jgi:hypothetical protein
MADLQDLHQIEYRHHQTKDLSPVASSMTSRESLAAWDSRIRAWVRHPHADLLSESACYQVFPNGQAALAWRYWNERAASREDGTVGRPLVSRVLVGPMSVLTPEAALASCRAGLSAGWAGPLPGQVPDDSELPMVSGAALTALACQLTSELDQAAATQAGLQAVVAAALAEPTVPLAIGIDDVRIQAPLRECVQCQLLWGLRRITGPLLGPAIRRGWSFSTFELPLGQTDPTSLPGIVFREAQDGVKAPPSRWRREARVRPFEDGALDDGASYAGMLEQAGWLIAEYQQRGGEGLERFISERGGSATSFTTRMGQVSEALRRAHQPSGPRRLAGLLGPRPASLAPEQEDSRPAPLAASAPADPAKVRTQTRPAPGYPESEPTESKPTEAGAGEPESRPAAGLPIEAARFEDIRDRGSEPRGSRPEASRPEASPPDDPQAWQRQAPWPAPGGTRPDNGMSGGSWYAEPASLPADGFPVAPADHEAPVDPPRPGPVDYGYGRYPAPSDPLASSRESETPPPLQLPDRDRPQPGGPQKPSHASKESVSSLLKRLELLPEDQRTFESILDSVYLASDMPPEERGRSWEVISSNGWYEGICRNNGFRSTDLANIFGVIVIPDLAEQPPAEMIARWALVAPLPMVEGLLTAARMSGAEMWNTVMEILEPALAYRWTIEHFMKDHWDDRRVVRSYAGVGHDDGNRGFLGLRRKSGRRS